jgi:Cu-Zn family superoxide dismutase
VAVLRVIVLAVGLLGLVACGDDTDSAVASPSPTLASTGGEGLDVTVTNAAGTALGTVSLTEAPGLVTVRAQLNSLAAGVYGFHFHTTGLCEAEAPDGPFTTAGGHYNPDAAPHGQHAGDLPPLFVPESGAVDVTFQTDRFTLGELTEGDGSALVIHEGPDNLANIPERYVPMPDEMTLGTGDSGARQACGPITPA